MSDQSKIEWCDFTFNPWMGCTKVSAGCQFCYAEALMDTRYGKVEWGPSGTRKRTSPANWKKPLKWAREAFDMFGRKARVFCASLADVGEDRPELVPWRKDLSDLIEQTWDQIDWLLLTKRPENMARMFPTEVLERSHVGTSIENQAMVHERLIHLLRCPAAIRFLSVEPLLGPVDLISQFPWCRHHNEFEHSMNMDESSPCFKGQCDAHALIDWVIVGGESGTSARVCDLSWVESIREQCQYVGIPCFIKQLGSWAVEKHDGSTAPEHLRLKSIKGGDMTEWPESLRVREFPRKAVAT